MFHQILDPLQSIGMTTLVALVPVALLLILLGVFRMTAWLAVIIGSLATILLATLVWHTPVGSALTAYWYGGLTGLWAVDWITFWGVTMYFTLVYTGLLDIFEKWMISQVTADVRVQAIILAWSFGALLEGLVGFGYPWAVIAPILIGLGIKDLDAIRVTAIANNAPVSYGALGVPIIVLAGVTGLPLLKLSGAVANIVALLALAPPWILIYMVTGRKGLKDGWPLAVVGSLSYILGQWPVAHFMGPWLPDITGAIVSFVCLLLLLKVWRPKTCLGYGGKEVCAADAEEKSHDLSGAQVFQAWVPFFIMVIVVVLGTWEAFPWVGHLNKVSLLTAKIGAVSSVTHKPMAALFNWNLFAGGTWIFFSWLIVVLLFAGKTLPVLGQVFAKVFKQMWGALLVGFFIFGLAFEFNYSGMAASLGNGFSKMGPAFILFAPILGIIGVALSGSNTTTNALFGFVQATVGKLLGFPVLLLPALNSVGAEVGKPIAPQTASVGASTTGYTRKEGEVIRHNMGWALVVLGYLILIGLFFYFVAPGVMSL
ncbi:MAG: L-lactate permease [Syntrophobacteraceae bacterium]